MGEQYKVTIHDIELGSDGLVYGVDMSQNACVTLDPETGHYWMSSVDLAHYLPMLELAGHHARHLVRITYVYNLHDQSIFLSGRDAQVRCERRIRLLPRYRPLRSLT